MIPLEVLRYAPWEVVSAVMGVALYVPRGVPAQSTRLNDSVYGFIRALGLATAPGYSTHTAIDDRRVRPQSEGGRRPRVLGYVFSGVSGR